MTTVLVVEDDDALREAITVVLNSRDLDTIGAPTGEDAIAQYKAHAPDLVLLDLRLPGLDGFDVLAVIRALADVPVVVLTVDDDRAKKLRALGAGADDYVTKPFDTEELLARVDALLRRTRGREPGIVHIESGRVLIDLGRSRTTLGDAEIRLTPTEWRILELLIRSAGALVTYDRLLRELRPGGERDSAAVRMHVNNLRRKLHDSAESPRLIGNEPGLGYRWLA